MIIQHTTQRQHNNREKVSTRSTSTLNDTLNREKHNNTSQTQYSPQSGIVQNVEEGKSGRPRHEKIRSGMTLHYATKKPTECDIYSAGTLSSKTTHITNKSHLTDSQNQ